MLLCQFVKVTIDPDGGFAIHQAGDHFLRIARAIIGGKGLFVKELEEAMLDGRADLAVHSMKDVPMEFPEGLGLVAICEREDPTDAFVSNHYDNVDALPHGAVVGTASLRREAQLRAYRPDLAEQVRPYLKTLLPKSAPLALSASLPT